MELNVLNLINFELLEDLGKNQSLKDFRKCVAFQLGQCLGLLDDKEFYTKSEIIKDYPDFKYFLLRDYDNPNILNNGLRTLIDVIRSAWPNLEIIQEKPTNISWPDYFKV